MNFSMDTGTAVVLPRSEGALSDDLTLTDSPGGGVIIGDIQQDSPVARTGTLKKGDQLSAVTIHFDNLNSEEVGKILKYTEPYKTSLKLNAKGELRSPDYGLKSSYMGSGDQTYLKLYNSKIKPHLKIANTGTGVGGLGINGKTPSIDISGPKNFSPNFDAKLKASPTIDVKTPSFDINGPQGKIQLTDVKPSKIGAGLITSGFDIKSPKGAIKMPDMEFKGPGFEMPSSNLKTDVNAPGIEIKSPKGGFDVNMANAELRAPKFETPSASFNGPNTLDMDLKLEAPKVKDVDLNLSTPNIDLETPNIDTDDFGAAGKIGFPKFKKNTFSLSGNKPKGPEVDVSRPEVKADLKTPDVDLNGEVDLPEAKGKWKMPSLQMPSFGLSGPKGPDVDFDGSVKAPSVDVSGPDLEANVATPDIDMKLPKGELDANLPDAELTGGKFKLPGVKWPSSKLSLSGPDKGLKLPKGQIDLSAPDIEGDIRGPSLDLKGPNIDVDAPNVEVPEAKGKFKLPSFHIPSFGFSGPKAPDLDVDGSLKGPSMDLSGPNIKGNLETPDVDLNLPNGHVDINIPKAEIQKPTFKMPKFNKPSANLSTPDTSLNLKAPKVTGDLNAKLKKPNLEIPGTEGPDVNLGGNLNIPDVDISAPDLKAGIGSAGIGFNKPKIGTDYDMPDMNLEVPEVKLKGPGLKKPSFNMSGGNVSVPEIDLNLSKPTFDLSAPKVQGDFKGPNIDINAPKVDGFGTEGKFKFPKFKKPTFSLSGNKPKGPEVDVSRPEVKADLKTPDVDLNGEVDLPEAKGKWKMPSLQMPSFGLSGPKGPDVDFDGSVKAPSVDVSGPDLKGNFETPDVDLKLPKGELNANLPDAELTGGKFKLPGVKWPSSKLSLSGPDKGLKLPKGQIDLSAPDIEGDIRGPRLDLKGPNIDVDAPNVEVPDAKGKFKLPSFQMPSFGFSGPKAPDLDVDGSLKGPSMDVSGPNIKGNLETPDVDLKLPKGELDANLPDAELTGGKFKLPGVKWPSSKLSLSGPDKGLKLPKGQIDLSAPDIEGDIRGPSLDLKGPNIDVDAPNVEVPDAKGKFKLPSFHIPSFGFSGPKAPDLDVDGSLKGPSMDLSGPNIKGNLETPDVDLNLPKGDFDINIPRAEIQKPTFKMPKFNKPSANLSTPDTSLNLKAPKVTGDLNAKLKKPNLEIPGTEGPDVNLGGNLNIPDVDISAPDLKAGIGSAGIGFNKPKIGRDYDMPDMNLEVPEVKLKGPGLKKPSFNMSGGNVSVPEIDLNLSKPTFDLSAPKVQGDFKGPNIDINAPKVDGFGTEGKFKFPKFKKPTFSLSGNKPKGPEVDVSIPEVKADLKTPDVDLKGGVDLPEAKGKWKMPSLQMPSFGLSGPKGPDVDFDGSVKAPSVDVSGPNLKGNFETPDVDLKLPKGELDANLPDAELTGGKFKLPGVKWPSSKLSLSGPDKGLNLPKGQIDLSAPDIEGDIRGPRLDLKGPNIDVDAPNVEVPDAKGKFKLPSFQMPSFGISRPKAPDLDVDGSLKGQSMDISGPNIKGNLETPDVDLKLPKGELDANLPDAELTGGKFKLPGVKWPSSKLSLSGPDKGLKLPKGQIDLSAPDIEGDIRGPRLDLKGPNIDVDAPNVEVPDAKGKFKLPSFHIPSFGFSGPKAPDLDVDGSLKGPSMDVSGPNIKGNLETPDVDLKLPKGELDANLPDAELTGGKFKLPGVKWPSSKLSLSGPDKGLKLPRGQIDLSAPDIEGDIRGPSLDLKGPNIDVDAPNVEVPDAKGKFKLPSFHIPSFGFSGPKAPDLDVDGSLKGPSMDLSGPNIKGNLETPDVDLNLPKGDFDINIPRAEIQKPTFKMPKFNKPSANLSTPDTSLNLKAPKVTGDLNAKLKKPNLEIPGTEGPDVNLGGNLNIPDVDISAPDLKAGIGSAGIGFNKPKIGRDYDMPDMNLEVPEVKLKGPGLKKPSFNMSGGNVSVPEIDLNLSKPTFDLSAPKVQGDFKGPNIDINAPKVDGFGTEGKFKFPKFKKPTFSLSGNKPKGPEVDVSIPEVKADLKTPDVDLKGGVDLPEAKGKWKMPSLQIPSFGLSGPKGPDVDFDGSVKAPSVDVSGPDLKGNFETPDVDLKLPKGELNANLPDAELTGGKFKLPGVNWPSSKLSLSGPDKGLNLPKGQIDLSAPDVEGDIRGPSLNLKGPNIDVDAPNVDVPDAKAKFKMPNINIPSLGFSGLKGPDMDFDSSLKAPSVDVSGPNLKGNIETPDVDLKLPKGELDANLPDAELTGGKFKLPGVKWPSSKLSLSGPDKGLKLPKGQIDLSAADLQGDIKGPSIDMKAPKIDINAPNIDVPEAKSKFKMPKVELPSIRMSGPKAPALDVDGSLKVPGVDVSSPKIKGNYKSPDFGMEVPDGDMDIQIPQADLNKQHFATPSINMPSTKWSSPDANFSLKTPTVTSGKLMVPALKKPNLEISGIEGPSVNVGGNLKVPKADISAPSLEGGIDLKKPKTGVGIDMPDVNLEVPDISAKGSGLKKPSLNVSPGNVDLNLPTANIKGGAGIDAAFQKKAKGANIGVRDTKFSVSSPNLDGEFREVGVDVSTPIPSAQLNVPKLKIGTDENVNMQNKFSRETFKVRSSSVSDLDDTTAQGKYDANLQAKSSSTINVNDTSISKKSKFKFSKLFNFNHKSKGSVDFTKAREATSSGTFTPKSLFPELEFSVSND